MILCINTTTAQFGVTLMETDGRILADFFISPGSRHFSHFMPTLDYLFTVSQTNIAEIEALMVATGPGSFTGLRVGLSVAKGFCHGLNIPIIGVSSLEAMANQIAHIDHPLCPLIDSKRDEVFAALFQRHRIHGLVRLKEDTCLRIGDLPSFVEGPAFFLGNDFNRQGAMVREAIGSQALLAPPVLWNLKASTVGAVGLKRFHEHDFDDLRELMPSYLRPPDIQPNPYPLLSE